MQTCVVAPLGYLLVLGAWGDGPAQGESNGIDITTGSSIDMNYSSLTANRATA